VVFSTCIGSCFLDDSVGKDFLRASLPFKDDEFVKTKRRKKEIMTWVSSHLPLC